MKKINILYPLIVLLGVLFFNSCDEIEEYPETRLFRPVLNNDLTSRLNTITVDMAKFKEAVSYKVEISRDTFKTIQKIKVYNTTENKFTIPDLLWNTLYQVRATAISGTEGFNSKISDLGAIRTERFPSALRVPSADDITDTEVIVRWAVTPTSAPVTQIKVFAFDDEELSTPLASYATNSTEQQNGAKTISNLTPNTVYQLAIFEGNTIKGWDFYKTLPALPSGADVVDLRGIVADNTTLLNALNSVPAGGTIILDPFQTYTFSGAYQIDKNLTLKSGYTLENTTGAIIDNSVGGDFALAPTATIDLIIFDGITFNGASGKYTFSPSAATSATVGEVRYVNCKINNYRDVIRSRSGWVSGGIGLFTIDNCIVTDITNAGMVIVDAGAFNPIPNIVLKRSTFSRVAKLINNRAATDSNSLNISDCTFGDSPIGATFMIEYLKTTNVLQGITIKNSIFGRASGATANYSFIKSGDILNTKISATNTFKTNDFEFTKPVQPAAPAPAITTPVPEFTVYGGPVTKLWVDSSTGDFNFADTAFSGSKTAGDPRWRK